MRGVYSIDDPELGAETVGQLAREFQDPYLPHEVNRLGRTIWRWRTQIGNWHHARVPGPTQAADNLTKRVKRVALG